MVEMVQALAGTPIPTILVVAGIIFLLLSVADKVSGHLAIPDSHKKRALMFGLALLIAGIALNLQSAPPKTTTADTPAPEAKVDTTAAAIAGNATDPLKPITTEWLTQGDYQMEWQRQMDRTFYPVTVEGKNEEGTNLYRSTFQPRPAAIEAWASHHGLTAESDAQTDADLVAQGYERIWMHSFIDAGHVARFQGVWIKKR